MNKVIVFPYILNYQKRSISMMSDGQTEWIDQSMGTVIEILD
jgi:hypothetical protein